MALITEQQDKAKPMAAAPIVYDDSGKVAWDKMWDSYCNLAKEGGPSHRGKDQSIIKKSHITPETEEYRAAMNEALRGVGLIVPYKLSEDNDGWITLELETSNKAKWFNEVINEENVEAKQNGKTILLPINDDFDVTHDVKSIITVVGKAHHYWKIHRSWFSKLIINIFGFDPQWIES